MSDSVLLVGWWKSSWFDNGAHISLFNQCYPHAMANKGKFQSVNLFKNHWSRLYNPKQNNNHCFQENWKWFLLFASIRIAKYHKVFLMRVAGQCKFDKLHSQKVKQTFSLWHNLWDSEIPQACTEEKQVSWEKSRCMTASVWPHTNDTYYTI